MDLKVWFHFRKSSRHAWVFLPEKVQKEYEQMLRMIGPEFEILRTVPLEEIRQKSGFLIAEGIERLRNGEVERIPGFDGEYGTIKLFQPYELEAVIAGPKEGC